MGIQERTCRHELGVMYGRLESPYCTPETKLHHMLAHWNLNHNFYKRAYFSPYSLMVSPHLTWAFYGGWWVMPAGGPWHSG